MYDLVTAVLFGGRRRQAFRTLAMASGARPGDRILDVGCGTGYFVRMLAETAGPTGSVTGVDAAPEMIAHASSRARSAAKVSFEVGSARELRFPDSSFDVVVSTLTMHHVAPAEQLAAVREMRRVLRPGGTLVIAEFQAPTGHAWGLLLGPTGLRAMAHAVPHVEKLVVEAGFSNISRAHVAPVLEYVRATAPPG